MASRQTRENVDALLIGGSFAEVASLLSGSTLSLIETLHVELSSGVQKDTIEELEGVAPSISKPLPGLQYYKVSIQWIKVNQILQEHDEVSLRCSVSGTPRPTIQWTLNGNLVPIDRFQATCDNNGNAQLTILDLDRRDAGVFQCTAINQLGSTSTECSMSIEAVDEYKFEVRLQVLSLKEVTTSVLEVDVSEQQLSEGVEGQFKVEESVAAKSGEMLESQDVGTHATVLETEPDEVNIEHEQQKDIPMEQAIVEPAIVEQQEIAVEQQDTVQQKQEIAVEQQDTVQQKQEIAVEQPVVESKVDEQKDVVQPEAISTLPQQQDIAVEQPIVDQQPTIDEPKDVSTLSQQEIPTGQPTSLPEIIEQSTISQTAAESKIIEQFIEPQAEQPVDQQDTVQQQQEIPIDQPTSQPKSAEQHIVDQQQEIQVEQPTEQQQEIQPQSKDEIAPTVSDALVELLFEKSNVSEFLEVTLEGDIDTLSLNVKEPCVPKSQATQQIEVVKESVGDMDAQQIVSDSQAVVNDSQIDLQFQTQKSDEQIEAAIVESNLDNSELSAKEPIAVQQQPQIEEQPIEIQIEEQAVVSDSQIDLQFQTKKSDEQIEAAIVESNLDNSELSAKQPIAVQQQPQIEEQPIEIQIEEQAVVSDSQIDLQFQTQKSDEQIEAAIVESNLDNSELSAKEPIAVQQQPQIEEQSATNDAQIDLQFQTQKPAETIEVEVLESNLDNSELSAKQPIAVQQQPQIEEQSATNDSQIDLQFQTQKPAETIEVSVIQSNLDDALLKTRESPQQTIPSESQQTVVSDAQIDLQFQTQKPSETIEVEVLESNLDDTLLSAKQPQIEQQPITSDSQIDLQFQTQKPHETIEVAVLQSNLDDALLKTRESPQRTIPSEPQQSIIEESPRVDSADIELLFKNVEESEYLEVTLQGEIECATIQVKEPKASDVSKADTVSSQLDDVQAAQTTPPQIKEDRLDKTEDIVVESKEETLPIVETQLESQQISEELPIVGDVQIELLFSKQQEPDQFIEILFEGELEEVGSNVREVKEKLTSEQVKSKVQQPPVEGVKPIEGQQIPAVVESKSTGQLVQDQQSLPESTEQIKLQTEQQLPTESQQPAVVESKSTSQLVQDQQSLPESTEQVKLQTEQHPSTQPPVEGVKPTEGQQPAVIESKSTSQLVQDQQSLPESTEQQLPADQQQTVETPQIQEEEPTLQKPIEQLIDQQQIPQQIHEEQQNPVVSDVQAELIFNQPESNQFVEVILEGAFEEVDFKTREIKEKTENVPSQQIVETPQTQVQEQIPIDQQQVAESKATSQLVQDKQSVPESTEQPTDIQQAVETPQTQVQEQIPTDQQQVAESKATSQLVQDKQSVPESTEQPTDIQQAVETPLIPIDQQQVVKSKATSQLIQDQQSVPESTEQVKLQTEQPTDIQQTQQQQLIVSDTLVDLQLNVREQDELLEAVMEGDYSEAQSTLKEPTIKQEKTTTAPSTEPTSVTVNEQDISTQPPKKPLISDVEIELLFSAPEYAAEIEAILEGAFEEVDAQLQGVKNKLPTKMEVPSQVEAPAKQQPIINETQIELQFNSTEQSDELDVILEGEFDEVEISVKQALIGKIPEVPLTDLDVKIEVPDEQAPIVDEQKGKSVAWHNLAVWIFWLD